MIQLIWKPCPPPSCPNMPSTLCLQGSNQSHGCRCSERWFKLAWQPLPVAVPHHFVCCFQIPEEEGCQPGPDSSGGVTPDVGDAELADVARLWQECQHGRSARRRARTSVTSMYSSGALPMMTRQFPMCQRHTRESVGRKCSFVTFPYLWRATADRLLASAAH